MVVMIAQCECAWHYRTVHLKRVMMVHFMLCAFYHNLIFFFFNGMGLAKKVAVGPSLRQQISALWRMRQGSGLAGGCEGGGEGDQELELWGPQGA